MNYFKSAKGQTVWAIDLQEDVTWESLPFLNHEANRLGDEKDKTQDTYDHRVKSLEDSVDGSVMSTVFRASVVLPCSHGSLPRFFIV